MHPVPIDAVNCVVEIESALFYNERTPMNVDFPFFVLVHAHSVAVPGESLSSDSWRPRVAPPLVKLL